MHPADNIPETRPATSRLDQAEHRLALLREGLDQITEGYTVFDSDLRLIGCNRAFLTLLDFPEEMSRIGTPFEDFMWFNARRGEYGNEDIEQAVTSRMAAARAFQPHSMERIRPNGRVIAVRGAPLPGGGFVTIYADITERRYQERLYSSHAAELDQRVRERTAELEATNASLRLANHERELIAAELTRSEGWLRTITDTVPALIAHVSRERIYRFVNKGYADWFGRQKDHVIGRAVAEVMGAELYQQVEVFMDQAELGETVSYEYSLTSFQPDGTRKTRHARSTIVPERNAQGAVTGMFVLGVDITVQKRTQEALIHAQKTEAVGKLTGGLAHDFNNLLTIIIGNLAALEERLADDTALPDRISVLDSLVPALRAARRGADITNRLLAFARQQPLETRAIDVGTLLGDLPSLLRNLLPDNIAVTIDVGGESTVARADAAQLEAALVNLAVNARDAMAEGGWLSIAASRLDLDDQAAGELEVEPGPYLLVGVTDTGHGMDTAVIARAIEPFFTTKAPGAGSGLGLSMVYGFTRQSGGAMVIESQPGIGTTVSLLLPAATRAEIIPGPPPVKAPVPPQSGTDPAATGNLVLLVEDEPEVRRVIRMQLIETGHLVLEAADAAEAVRLLDTVPTITALVSDVAMPGAMDGRALGRLARQMRPDLRIILISGHDSTFSAANSGHPLSPSGSIALLRKPFTRKELADAILAAQPSLPQNTGLHS